MSDLLAKLDEYGRLYPGGRNMREPVHVIYGGADRFKRDTVKKLSNIALHSFEANAETSQTFQEIFQIESRYSESVFKRVKEKLSTDAIEDLRIDFEDGYGVRSDDEEDTHAEQSASETSAAMDAGELPEFFGIRIKAFSPESLIRAKRTLNIYLTVLIGKQGKLPHNFVITLPKPVIKEQVSELAEYLSELEDKLGLKAGSTLVEIMVETPQALIGSDGRIALRGLADAAAGRCVAAHFGAYDHTASLGVISRYQTYDHPACDMARGLMQLSLAGTGIRISDGATNIMPIGPHRGSDISDEQRSENRETVRRAWRLHYDNIHRSLTNGIYQGWDLHPAQLPARYAAVYSFFLENAESAGERLRKFMSNAARATLAGDVFDDAATGQGLLNYFTRAIDCGAISEDEAVRLSGLSIDDLRSGSFAHILVNLRSQI